MKVALYSPGKRNLQFTAFKKEILPLGLTEQEFTDRTLRTLAGFGYSGGDPLILSLPRDLAACRYLRVPAKESHELEKIIALQASRYLPYSSAELVTAYQTISVDRNGNSNINMVIVHKDIIERYGRILNRLNVSRPVIILSSYGICNIFRYVNPSVKDPVMLIDIDSGQAELSVSRSGKLIFSRYFKFYTSDEGLKDLFLNEINRTLDAYSEEVTDKIPEKIFILGESRHCGMILEAIDKETPLHAAPLPFYDKIRIHPSLKQDIGSNDSFASLIGLALSKPDGTLNLMAREAKEKFKIASSRRQRLELVSVASAAFLFFALATAKNINNKSIYLKHLKTELNRIEKEVKPLEDMKSRLDMLAANLQNESTELNLLYELHKIMPSGVTLRNLSYYADGQLILRGEAKELSLVFLFERELEKSEALHDSDVKIKYATQKKTMAGESTDFELACRKSR